MNNDLISRQAILKHIDKARHIAMMMDDIHVISIIMKGLELCEKAVRNQPSAQPDNDMIHLQKEQAYMQGWEDGREALRKEMWEDGRDRPD